MQKLRTLLSFTLLYLSLSTTVMAEGVDDLASKVGDSITGYFQAHPNRKATIMSFENHSDLKGIGAMRFYQLLLSRLENSETFDFQDTLKGFNGKSGDFREGGSFQYLIWLRLTSRDGKLGVGAVIFSRLTDRIEFLKYYETDFMKPEADILHIDKFGFERSGFNKVFNLPIEAEILDFTSINYGGGEFLFILKRYSLEIWKRGGGSGNLKRVATKDVSYGFPEKPAIEEEGLITVFPDQGILYIYSGTNFSDTVNSWSFDGETIEIMGAINFIPIGSSVINGKKMLLGINYLPGFNWFTGEIYISGVDKGKPINQELYKKKVPEFFSISFWIAKDLLQGIYLVDKSYNLKSYDANFREIPGKPIKAGASVSVIEPKWLVTTGITEIGDELTFYKIGRDNNKVYSSMNKQKIHKLKSGVWEGKSGVWIKKHVSGKTLLEFWRENHEAN